MSVVPGSGRGSGWSPRGRSRRRGQALVEFAVMLPVLLTLSLGTADFGRVFATSEAISNAAREGARQAAYQLQNTTPAPSAAQLAADALAAAQSELGPAAGANLSAPSYTCPASGQPPLSAPFAQSMFPTAGDHGYLYTCTWTDGGSAGDGEQHIEVVILWRQGLWTPIVSVTGVPYLHGIADATGA